MPKYVKDEINFHGFLVATRQIHNVSLKQLAEGLCSESEMQRVEKGERLPEKLMRDRIVARLGISDDNYEKLGEKSRIEEQFILTM